MMFWYVGPQVSRRRYNKLASKERFALGFSGILVAALGVVTLALGKLHYDNYRGGAVFAPFAILLGALILFVAVKMGKQQ